MKSKSDGATAAAVGGGGAGWSTRGGGSRRPQRSSRRRQRQTLALAGGVVGATAVAVSVFPIWLWSSTTTTRSVGDIGDGGPSSPASSSYYYSYFRDAVVGSGAVASSTATSSWGNIKPTNSTLALLYPPGLLGGYRNQFIRFTSLVAHASLRNLSYLYLPSLLWSTTVHDVVDNEYKNSSGSGNENNASSPLSSYTLAIPMEYIFDIDAYNEYATSSTDDPQQQQRLRQRLPIIVKEITQSDCWIRPQREELQQQQQQQQRQLHPLQVATLERGTIRAIANRTRVLVAEQNSDNRNLNGRRMDLLDEAERECRHPRVYGGGKMAGRLWNDHVNKYTKDGSTRNYPNDVDRHVLKALRPLPKWRQAAEKYCFGADAGRDVEEGGGAARGSGYLALHARIELEMLAHPCGVDMERNLTRIFDSVRQLLDNRTASEPVVDSVFVAVWRHGIDDPNFYNNKRRNWVEIADHNLATLNRYTLGTPSTEMASTARRQPPELLGGRYRVLECGTQMMDRYYKDHPDAIDHGTLLEQAINFDLAVQAAYFVGVRGSSYSTDVWTTRYHLGRGQHNFRYTKDGIEPVESGGLPDPHGNCKGKKKS